MLESGGGGGFAGGLELGGGPGLIVGAAVAALVFVFVIAIFSCCPKTRKHQDERHRKSGGGVFATGASKNKLTYPSTRDRSGPRKDPLEAWSERREWEKRNPGRRKRWGSDASRESYEGDISPARLRRNRGQANYDFSSESSSEEWEKMGSTFNMETETDNPVLRSSHRLDQPKNFRGSQASSSVFMNSSYKSGQERDAVDSEKNYESRTSYRTRYANGLGNETTKSAVRSSNLRGQQKHDTVNRGDNSLFRSSYKPEQQTGVVKGETGSAYRSSYRRAQMNDLLTGENSLIRSSYRRAQQQVDLINETPKETTNDYTSKGSRERPDRQHSVIVEQTEPENVEPEPPVPKPANDPPLTIEALHQHEKFTSRQKPPPGEIQRKISTTSTLRPHMITTGQTGQSARWEVEDRLGQTLGRQSSLDNASSGHPYSFNSNQRSESRLTMAALRQSEKNVSKDEMLRKISVISTCTGTVIPRRDAWDDDHDDLSSQFRRGHSYPVIQNHNSNSGLTVESLNRQEDRRRRKDSPPYDSFMKQLPRPRRDSSPSITDDNSSMPSPPTRKASRGHQSRWDDFHASSYRSESYSKPTRRTVYEPERNTRLEEPEPQEIHRKVGVTHRPNISAIREASPSRTFANLTMPSFQDRQEPVRVHQSRRDNYYARTYSSTPSSGLTVEALHKHEKRTSREERPMAIMNDIPRKISVTRRPNISAIREVSPSKDDGSSSDSSAMTALTDYTNRTGSTIRRYEKNESLRRSSPGRSNSYRRYKKDNKKDNQGRKVPRRTPSGERKRQRRQSERSNSPGGSVHSFRSMSSADSTRMNKKQQMLPIFSAPKDRRKGSAV